MIMSNRQRYVMLCEEQESTPAPTYRDQLALIRIAEALDVSVSVLTGRNRTPKVVQLRQAAMWLLRQTGLSSTAIGRLLNRDHSTVLYGLRIIEGRRCHDGSLADQLDRLSNPALVRDFTRGTS